MKKIVAWINRIFTHDRDTEHDFGIRALMHVPIGFLFGIIPIPSDKFVDLFIFYERNEDRHTQDQAWKDTYGALVGMAIGRICLLGAIAYIGWRLL